MAARYERVSLREYARRLSISDAAVRQAIKDGKINKGFDQVEKKIIVEIADREWGSIHKTAEEPSVSQAKETESDKPEAKLPAGKLKIDDRARYAEAKRVNEVLKAKKAMIELEELEGKLIAKETIDQQLFVAGAEIRKAFERLPARCIDAIMMAKNRNAALLAMEEEIQKTLESLPGIIEGTFKTK